MYTREGRGLRGIPADNRYDWVNVWDVKWTAEARQAELTRLRNPPLGTWPPVKAIDMSWPRKLEVVSCFQVSSPCSFAYGTAIKVVGRTNPDDFVHLRAIARRRAFDLSRASIVAAPVPITQDVTMAATADAPTRPTAELF